MTLTIHKGDLRRVLPTLPADSVDAVLTDPPYHLQPMVDRFGKAGAQPAQHGRDGAMARLSAGFMGREWDGGDIAFQADTWRAVGRVLKPGGYMAVFGGARTHHRAWCAVEDADFIIQDTSMWLYGHGFPKGAYQLKPAHQPICIARKAGGEKLLDARRGRHSFDDKPEQEYTVKRLKPGADQDGGTWNRQDGVTYTNRMPAGRWPANVAHDGSPEAGSVLGDAARYFYCARPSPQEREGGDHPTQKPLALMRWLTRLLCPPGGLVLDPFCGSGTTLLAAWQEGRSAIGVEADPDYVAIMQRRLAAAVKNNTATSNSKAPAPVTPTT